MALGFRVLGFGDLGFMVLGVQDQASMKVMRPSHSSVMAAQQFQSRSRNLTMSPPQYLLEADNEKYNHQKNNGVLIVSEQPVSTFSVDVDTASYANVRRLLNQGCG